jgi:predicted alpha/beta-fold hydrolase
MSEHVIPKEKELSKQIHLELSDYGGHVGFIGATKLGYPKYWLEQRIIKHLQPWLG